MELSELVVVACVDDPTGYPVEKAIGNDPVAFGIYTRRNSG
jgi:hypothetical protein